MSLRLLKHEIRHQRVRIFYNEHKEWDRKFKMVYYKTKVLTAVIYELEKLLWQYKTMELPEECGVLR